tara:strand:+ start:130132 stop:130314 length:183 start_codon:yes stop_codon:yes gene_type:complete
MKKDRDERYVYNKPVEIDIKDYIKDVLSKNTDLNHSEINDSCDVFSKGMSSYYVNGYWET